MNLLLSRAISFILFCGLLCDANALSASADTAPASATSFAVGARIQTIVDAPVRQKSGTQIGKQLCTQPAGTPGNIIEGPIQSNGNIWWNINYSSSCDGLSAEIALYVIPEISGLDLSFCDDTASDDAGVFCAVQPSATDIRIRDVYSTSGSQDDQTHGFGYHAVAIPTDWHDVKGLSIFLGGTSTRPYDSNTRSFGSSVWLNEQMAQGYAVIQLAYNNRYSVNEDLCGKGSSGYNRDNCAGEVREELLTGADVSPYVNNDIYNGIDYRLKALLKHLARYGVVFPNVNPNNVDWSRIRISGHSQGANQGYYIARKRVVAFDCILSGGAETTDAVNPSKTGMTDWFVTGTSSTPTQNLGALIATAEPDYGSFLKGLQYIGLTSNQIVQATQTSFSDQYGEPIEAHAGTVQDPSLAPLRARACFR